jgi:hypothetical protein
MGNGAKRKTADRTSDQGGHGAGVSNRVFEPYGESVFPVPTKYLRELSPCLPYDVFRDEARDEAGGNRRGLPESDGQGEGQYEERRLRGSGCGVRGG